MTIPINITKKERTINFGGTTITLNEGESYEQAIARVQNPTTNGGRLQEGTEEKEERADVEGTK